MVVLMVIPNSKDSIASPIIFQTKVHGIEVCNRANLNKEKDGARIAVRIDCQSVIGALNSYSCESKLVFECRSLFQELVLNKKINRIWVSGYQGVPVNE